MVVFILFLLFLLVVEIARRVVPFRDRYTPTLLLLLGELILIASVVPPIAVTFYPTLNDLWLSGTWQSLSLAIVVVVGLGVLLHCAIAVAATLPVWLIRRRRRAQELLRGTGLGQAILDISVAAPGLPARPNAYAGFRAGQRAVTPAEHSAEARHE